MSALKLNVIAGALTLTLAGGLHADVIFDWAVVGDPGNAADQLYANPNNPINLQFGAVAYTYRIAKHEVTNSQYTEFLNAVDAMGTNPNSVYDNAMGSQTRGGIAFDNAAANGAKYSPKVPFCSRFSRDHS